MPTPVIISIIILSIIIFILLILFAISYLIHGKVFNNRFTSDPLISFYTKEEFNLNYIPVEMKCNKEVLRGNIYFYDNKIDDKIIVFAHGMWSSTKAYIQDIEYLCRAGFKVLGFDYIGTDESTGKAIKGLANGLKSLDYAIDYIKTNYPNKEIYVVGHSWGGFNSLNVIKYHTDIKKVVAMAPFISIKTALKSMLPKKLWFLIPVIVFIEYLKCGKYAYANAIKSLNSFSGKVYILASKDDHMINFNNNSLYIKNVCKNKNIEYKFVDNKYHNPNYASSAVEALLAYSKSLANKTDEEIINIKKNTNFHELGKLDTDIMNEIVAFLNK